MNFLITTIILSVLATIAINFLIRKYPKLIPPFLRIKNRLNIPRAQVRRKHRVRQATQIPSRIRSQRQIQRPQRAIVQHRQRPNRLQGSKAWKYKVLPHRAPNIPRIKFHERPVPNLDVYLLEMRPQVTKIFEQNGHPRREVRFIAWPYSYHMIIMHHGGFAGYFIFFSPVAINNNKSLLCFSPLPNQDSSGLICWGDRNDFIDTNAEIFFQASTRARLIKIIKEFFASTFTNHLRQVHFNKWGRIDQRLSSFRTWERATRKNPNFILSIPWKKRAAGTVDYVMNYAWRR